MKLGKVWRWLRKAIAKVAQVAGVADKVLPPAKKKDDPVK